MKKLRSDARWHTFTPEQQKKIQHWLFEDHLSYQKTRELMKTEFGLVCALSTVGCLYSYLDELRSADNCNRMLELAEQVDTTGAQVEKLRTASKILLASQLLEKCQNRMSLKEITKLSRLALQSEHQDMRQRRAELLRDRLAWLASRDNTAASQAPGAPSRNGPPKTP